MTWDFFVIPIGVLITAVGGSAFTSQGLGWYAKLKKPGFTPRGSTIGLVWTGIFILTAISGVWASRMSDGLGGRTVLLAFFVNLLLNALWSFLFFERHLLRAAILEACLLGLSVVLIIVLVWPVSRQAALLLLPYAAWVFFAAFLNYRIWRLNPKA